MIQALPSTPVAALSFQWYRRAPYMLDVPLGPLIGGTVVTRKAWDRLSDAERAALSATAKEAEQRLLAEVPRRDQEAVAEMQKRGLRVTRVDPATRAAWRATADEMAGTMRGGLVPAEFYDLALRARDDYRRGERGGGR
jgi:TRAP-type C4-dicarboxylate transport system substrate-binding protein